MIKGESRKSAALNEREDGKLIDHMFLEGCSTNGKHCRYKKRCLERNSTGKGDTNRIRVMNARVEMSRWRKICGWEDGRLICDDSPAIAGVFFWSGESGDWASSAQRLTRLESQTNALCIALRQISGRTLTLYQREWRRKDPRRCCSSPVLEGPGPYTAGIVIAAWLG